MNFIVRLLVLMGGNAPSTPAAPAPPAQTDFAFLDVTAFAFLDATTVSFL